MIYLYVLRHTESGLLWLGKAKADPAKQLPVIKHWKWLELMQSSPGVSLVDVRAFRDKEKSNRRLRQFRNNHRVKTSARWVNSDVYLDKGIPYVYMIRHRETNELYVGSSWGKKANPCLFGTNYRTSSWRVKELGWENFDVVEVRSTRNARDYEASLLQKWHRDLGTAVFCELFLNRNTSPGIILDEDTRVKASTKGRMAWEAKTPTELDSIHARRASSLRETLASKPEIYWKMRGELVRSAVEQMTEAQKVERSRRLRLAIENRTPERKAEIKEKIRFSKMNKSPEELAEIYEKTASRNRGCKRSQETRARISAAKKGQTLSSEHRAKIGAAHLGMKRSPQTRAKMSLSRIGMKFTKSHRLNISRAKLGVKHNRTFIES